MTEGNHHGIVLGDGPPTVVYDEIRAILEGPGAPVSLSEAIRLGLVTGSLEAIRKASQRPGFPEPVATWRLSRLYNPSDLREWQQARYGGRPQLPGAFIPPLPEPPEPVIPEPVWPPGLELPPGRPEAWKPIPGFSGYQASDKGRIRSVDRRLPDGRYARGRVLAPREGNRGYMLIGLTDDGSQKQTRSVHRLVLLAFAGPCPEGQETRHGKYGPTVNWWPENICYGTKEQNAADKPVNGGGLPTFPCRNAPACGNMVMNEGRRCRSCVTRSGRIIAAMINAGLSLETAADRMDYESADWAWKLACEFGDPPPSVTKRDARRQRPGLAQRARITLRDRRVNGWGDRS